MNEEKVPRPGTPEWREITNQCSEIHSDQSIMKSFLLKKVTIFNDIINSKPVGQEYYLPGITIGASAARQPVNISIK